MSRSLKNKITDKELVIPYLYNLFYKCGIKKNFNIDKIYLVGSRGRNSVEDWDKSFIKYKDWDLLIQTNRKIKHPNLWIDNKYHIEIIICDTEDKVTMIRGNNRGGSGLGFELFPNTPEELKIYIIK